MAVKPRAKGIPPVSNYAALSAFAAFVIVSLTGNAIFLTPEVSIVDLTAAQAALDAAISDWGAVGARGSHVQLMALRSAAVTMRGLLVQELGYVQNTVVLAGGTYAEQAAAMTTSGYGVKNAGSPQGLLGQPENFHQRWLNSISIFHVALKWSKMVGLTSRGNCKNFQIWKNTVANSFTDVNTVLVGTSTRTSFIDTNPGVGPVWYFCTGSNDAGIGAPTAGLLVNPIS